MWRIRCRSHSLRGVECAWALLQRGIQSSLRPQNRDALLPRFNKVGQLEEIGSGGRKETIAPLLPSLASVPGKPGEHRFKPPLAGKPGAVDLAESADNASPDVVFVNRPPQESGDRVENVERAQEV